MSEKTFAEALNDHIPYEFAAHQQYLATAIYYDDLTMPRMAAFFYRQSVEERDHALMIIRYLLDIDAEVTVPGIEAPSATFDDIAAPVRLAIEQERSVTDRFNKLASIARAANDFQGEQFLQWFLKEQVEEVSLMNDLLTVVERGLANPLEIEDFLAREGFGEEGGDTTAPAIAGA
ncbi:ferritin [soil metagenome]